MHVRLFFGELEAPCIIVVQISRGEFALGAKRGSAPSVLSVTYGVVLRILLSQSGKGFAPCLGSERVKLWFRKGQTLVPKGSNANLLWTVPDRSNILVPDRSNFGV